MPIVVHAQTRRMPQPEFGAVAYRVMNRVFQVHNQMGRFFNEPIYQKAIAAGLSGAQAEVQIEVMFADFCKHYFMDLLVNDGAVFELKAVDKLIPRHRAQLLNYLLLAELSHGKLVNIRPEMVEHEFVNTTLTREDRIAFTVEDSGWSERDAQCLKDRLVAVLRDWGTGLELPLYTEVVTHLLGGEALIERDVDVQVDGQRIGRQTMRLASPGVAFHITQIDDRNEASRFHDHAQRLLHHTDLQCIQWINVTLRRVTFQTIDHHT